MRIVVVLGMIVACWFASIAEAQPRRPQLTPAERREAIKKKIRSMRAYTLTEELSLDEQTAGKLFPVLAKFDDQTDKLLQRRVEIQRQLKDAGSLKDPKLIDRAIDDAVANQKAFRDLEDQRLAELRRFLAPAQTAKLLVVLPEFERRIQNQLRRAILNQSAKQGGGAPAGDDDDDLDDAPSPPPRKQGGQAGPPGLTKPKCDPYSATHGC